MIYALELEPLPDPVEVFARLARLPHCIFFDSARRDAELGRYSFVAADPFAYWETPADGTDALAPLARRLSRYPAEPRPDLPPFQGGAAGLWSYDLNRSLERLPAPRHDEFQLPAAAFGLYDVVVAFDHQQQRGWILSQGFPQQDPGARRQRAADRAAEFRHHLGAAPPDPRRPPTRRPPPGAVGRRQLAPQFPCARDPALLSNFSAASYRAAIARAVDYVAAGDVFQVNLAQRLLYPAPRDVPALYQRLRGCNPAPFAGYFDLGAFQIVSASPERFLQLRDRRVETRPIKGTRLRCGHPEADLVAARELRMSEKDRAENIMIVDLLRNDLSRVCRPASVHVTALCRLEAYQYVQHLVSVVVGTLAEGCTPVDLVRVCFPGGSVTGAPKVRAMEIIQELEPTARGAYCGALGYIGFDGAMDSNILIRTLTVGRGWCQLPVGGGIVAQSIPELEYEETWHKALGLLRALQPEDAG